MDGAATWEEQEETLRSLGLEATHLHFDQTSLTDEVRRRLARDIERTARSFDTPASTMERECRLLELLAFAPQPLFRVALIRREVRARTPGGEACQRGYWRRSPSVTIPLTELAALTKLNLYYLYEVFKRDVGLSPHSYQTSVRIHRVKQLLAAGTPITQAALALGFSDQSHLTHTFRKYTKVTPGQFPAG